VKKKRYKCDYSANLLKSLISTKNEGKNTLRSILQSQVRVSPSRKIFPKDIWFCFDVMRTK